MAAVDADISEDDEQETSAPEKKKRLAGKVIVLYVVLPALLLIGAGAGVYMSGILGGGESDEAVAEVKVDPVFYDLPDFLVNLSGPPPQHYLKLRVALQVKSKEAVPQLEMLMPRVLDGFQTFLRELRPEDLEGSRGMLYLKEELLRRLNLATQEPIVTDVLFKEIIVQ
ncbi:flagellar basal body-associated FliL family protein [Parvibaculum sp.]|jgi:flagellar FliL protein|uniref:flagellar basal body-associated FliL family protein n=1 Tax=Parvibaculum sp. TaxID=2024848 RepID=UPI000C45D3A6|nr:flagellar basal body-associated FliL family protein [Parvibaculum sp.]HAC59729.1 flagellar basal body protein FliL [Rhodobiaceae bacterium]MAU60037.1 flagellar basal body protein FliL [Parvibaculum sp.]MBO6668978.1 flagellar basal body-associated FliL family protein [Parvibaculum sp.]MBO6692097.1 flagellar basal body-associated FliL family protein [Parvibaculum sp.]MBO6715472.1 flagellar basal body-associated FliL family protein [Parvibaculum sp.]|tara:strand:+ start:5140 stop:5646 length:507 start_codon:yes stop_codon:yes gene_type:complete